MKKSLFITLGICFALTLGMPGLAMGQTSCPPANLRDVCPFTATAGLETGLQDLAFVQMNPLGQGGHGAMVDWGDQSVTVGLVRCFEPVLHPYHCHVFGTHIYTTPKTYQIVIHYDPPIGSEETVGVPATISSVKDFVILSIGDSVASGEGDPVVQFGGPVGCQPTGGCIADSNPPQGFWDDPGSDSQNNPPADQSQIGRESAKACHRSVIAGPSQAARQLITSNRDSTGADTITFAHLACSGATLSFVPEEERNASDLIDQLRIARKVLPRIDVLLISGGANNMAFRTEFYGILNNDVAAGFGAVISRCIGGEFSQPCQNDGKFTTDINDSINGNPGRELDGSGGTKFHFPGLHSLYQDLDKEIHCINPGDYLNPGDKDKPEPSCSEQQIPKVTLITEYFDPTHDDSGSLFALCLSIRKPTWAYLFTNVMQELNKQAHNSPWQVVGGIQNDFLTHGLCASNSWVVNPTQSFARQNDQYGSGHPNDAGQADYRDRVYAAIVQYNPPETTPSATTDGQPYAFGTWTTHNVTLSLSAANAIKESGVGATFYAVDNANCLPSGPGVIPAGCLTYGGPFMITTSGKHTVTFFSQNGQGFPEPAQSVQVWVDNEPPVMACKATPSVLWPPNNKMVPVSLNVTAVSAAFGPTPFSLKSVTTSGGNAATDIAGFVIGQPSVAGFLRASRPGNAKAGESYTFVYQSSDPLGLTGTCAATVTVPHDQRRSKP